MSRGGHNRKRARVGDTFNHLTLTTEPVSNNEGKRAAFVGDFLCKCGVIKTMRTAEVMRGKIKSCGCMMHSPEVVAARNAKMCETKRKTPKIGEKFHFLSFAGNVSTVYGSGKSRFMGEFDCECGAVVCKEISGVRAGKIKSCGCQQYSSKVVTERKLNAMATVRAKNGLPDLDDNDFEASKKPSRPGARVIKPRHNYDAMPRRASVSIGSVFSLI